jgi:hypothetical protein
LAVISFMRHSGEVAPFASRLSTRAYTERIRNDKSACRKVCQRLRGSQKHADVRNASFKATNGKWTRSFRKTSNRHGAGFMPTSSVPGTIAS